MSNRPTYNQEARRKRRNSLLLAATIVIGMVTIALIFTLAISTVTSPFVQRAPSGTIEPTLEGKAGEDWDFVILYENGTELNISSFTDEPLIIEFLASWCVPCHQQSEEFNELLEDYNQSVRIIGITIDLRDTLPDMHQYKINHNFPGNISVDVSSTGTDLFDVLAIPVVIYISEGEVVFESVGLTNAKTLNQAIEADKEEKEREVVAPNEEVVDPNEEVVDPNEEGDDTNTGSTIQVTFLSFDFTIPKSAGIFVFFLFGAYIALSPCLLPLIPLIFIQSFNELDDSSDKITLKRLDSESEANINSSQEKASTQISGIEKAILLTTGIGIVFTVLLFVGFWIGQFLIRYYSIFNFIFGALLLISGIIMILPKISAKFFSSTGNVMKYFPKLEWNNSLSRTQYLGLGLLFPIIALPCVAPIMLAIIPLAVLLTNPFTLFLGLIFFVLGIFLPYLALALLSNNVARMQTKYIQKYVFWIKIIGAVLIMIIGILFILQWSGTGTSIFSIS